MNLNEELNRIKSIMKINEDFAKPDLSPEYIMQRIPFLKSANNNSNHKVTSFQKVMYNSNVDIKMGDEIYNFPNFNTVIEFQYSKYMINDKFEYNFNLEFELIITKPKNMDSLLYTVMSMMSKKQMENLSYYKSFVIPDEHIPENVLNDIINEINKHFFQYEEYITETLPADLKNPIDESVDPKSVTTNYTSLQSIIDDKRPVGTIALHPYNTEENNIIGQLLNRYNINAAKVPKNDFLYIIFKEPHRNQGEKLLKLYADCGGQIKPTHPYQIRKLEGQLLSYPDKDIEEFLSK